MKVVVWVVALAGQVDYLITGNLSSRVPAGVRGR